MAFMKGDLTGPHRGKAALVSDLKRRRPSVAANVGRMIKGAAMPISRMPNRPFDVGRDFVPPSAFPPRGGPRGFPGMGDYKPPPWQTMQPGFYESDSMGTGPGPDGGGLPPSAPQHPHLPPEGLVPGMSDGPINPAIMALIRDMMQGRSRPRWEGSMRPGGVRGTPPSGSYF